MFPSNNNNLKKKHLRIWARFSALLLARLIADRRTNIDPCATGRLTVMRTQKDAQAALLQDVDVVIVGVAHRPAG